MNDTASLTKGTVLNTIRHLADVALDSPNGVSCFFYDEEYGGEEEARKKALVFRNSFNVMKGREHTKLRRIMRVATVDTKYDDLGCTIERIEKGWKVTLGGDNALKGMHVVVND